MSLKERPSSLRNSKSLLPDGDAPELSEPVKVSRVRSTSQSGMMGFFGRIKDAMRFQSRDIQPAVAGIRHRATSTPALSHCDESFGRDIDLSAILPESPRKEEFLDFAELGAFGESKKSLHKDFDNDITAYTFYKQVRIPDSIGFWGNLGGQQAFTRSMLFVFELFYDSPLPREVTHLAAYYICSLVQTGCISREELEPLLVSAVNLASKVETQSGLRRRMLREFNLSKVLSFEKMIMRTVDYVLWPTTMPAFMRLLVGFICKKEWHWEFAKCASELAMCDLELVHTKPSLLAGVVMRLVSLLEGGDTWKDDCYVIIQEPPELYNRPHTLLCRVLLCAYSSPNKYAPISSKYGPLLNKVLTDRWDYLQAEVDMANIQQLSL